MLTASHLSLRHDFEVSSSRLDLAVATALDADALGERMTGRGFGGSAIALVEADAADEVTYALRREFADLHAGEPGVFTAVAAGGAGPV